MPTTATSVFGWRLGFFYATYFAIIGIQMPFWPVWLERNGLSVAEIGVLYAVGVSVKAVSVPLLAQIADRSGNRRILMITFAGLSSGVFLLFHAAGDFWTFLAITVIFHAVWASVLPLGESLAIAAVRRHDIDYGKVRVWGSWGFIASAGLTGYLLSGQGTEWIFFAIACALALCFIATLLLPAIDVSKSAAGRAPLLAALRQPKFMLLISSTALIQGSHSVYYAFGTLHWQRLGIEPTIIGILWAEGVLAEICLFMAGARLLRTLRPEQLLLIAGLAAAIRWTATGLIDWLPGLFVIQLLHAFSFRATHLGIMRWIADHMPQQYSASAQAVHTLAVSVVGFGAGGLLAGQLFQTFGGGAYIAMGIVGVLGALVLSLHRTR